MDSGNNSTVILFRAHSLPPIIDTYTRYLFGKGADVFRFFKNNSKTIQKLNTILLGPGFQFYKELVSDPLVNLTAILCKQTWLSGHND